MSARVLCLLRVLGGVRNHTKEGFELVTGGAIMAKNAVVVKRHFAKFSPKITQNFLGGLDASGVGAVATPSELYTIRVC